MQDRIFYSTTFGFIFGVFFSSIFKLNFYFILLIVFLALISLLFFNLIRKNNWGKIASVFFLFIAFGVLYFNFFENRNVNYLLEDKVNQNISLEGVIDNNINTKENSKSFMLEVEKNNKKFYVLVNASLDSYVKYGDRVSVEGKLTLPENFITDIGKEFDYVNYLKKDKIFYLFKATKIKVLSENNKNPLKAYLFNIKNAFVEKINFIISPYQSTLLNGLILGEKSSFPDDLEENFIKTGTIHIVALSGYNVTIVAEWLMKMLYFLPTVLAIYAGIFAIILFVVMTGASSTAIRAGIMAVLVLIARVTGRNYDVFRALVLAAFVMILINPYVLYFDVSFQLSFIATIAVIFFTPRIEKYFLWITDKFNLRDIIAVTFAAYVFVLPFVLYKMGNLSIVALPTNILILPFIPFTMLLGFVTGILGFISNYLGLIGGYITYLFLSYELEVINLFASLPFASFSISNFPVVLTIFIYLYFIYFLFGANIKSFFSDDFTY